MVNGNYNWENGVCIGQWGKFGVRSPYAFAQPCVGFSELWHSVYGQPSDRDGYQYFYNCHGQPIRVLIETKFCNNVERRDEHGRVYTPVWFPEGDGQFWPILADIQEDKRTVFYIRVAHRVSHEGGRNAVPIHECPVVSVLAKFPEQPYTLAYGHYDGNRFFMVCEEGSKYWTGTVKDFYSNVLYPFACGMTGRKPFEPYMKKFLHQANVEPKVVRLEKVHGKREVVVE